MNNPWFQLVASLISMVMIANLQYSWTLFVNPIQDATAWKLAEIQAAFAWFVLLQTWVQPLDGWFIDRMGPRKLFLDDPVEAMRYLGVIGQSAGEVGCQNASC